jgi:hypothetical protein
VAVGVAAASAIAAGVTAVVVSDEMSRQEDRIEQVAESVGRQGMRRAAEAAAADPRARTVHLDGSAAEDGAVVVTLPDGAAFVMAHDVSRLAPGRTYQLWAVTGDPSAPQMVSAGLLGRSFDVAAFHAPEGTQGFMVTDEAAPGATQMGGVPVLEGHYA